MYIIRLLVIFLCFTSTLFAYPIDIEDATGHTLHFDNPPKQIISLSPYVTETLFLLKNQNSVIAVTSYCKYPLAAQAKESIGNLTHPHIEKIISLKPDCVFATKEDQRKETVDTLRRLGIRVFVLGEVRNFQDSIKNLITISDIMGKEKQAAEIIKNAETRIKAITENKNKKQKTVFCALGLSPLVTVSKGSFLDESIRLANGINIAHKSKSRYPMYSIEEVVQKNPDIIITIAMDTETRNIKKHWNNYPFLNAVKNNQIFIIDPDKVCRATPTVFADTVEIFHNLMYEKKR